MNKKYRFKDQTSRIIRSMMVVMAILLLFGLVLPFHSIAEENKPDPGDVIANSEIVDELKEPDVPVESPKEVVPQTTSDIISENPQTSGNTATSAENVGTEITPQSVTPALSAVNSIVANGSIQIQNYFAATGQSTNGRYKVKGVYFEPDGDAHILIYVMNNTNYQPFIETVLNNTTVPNVTWEELGQDATLVLPDGSTTISLGNVVDGKAYGGTIAQILDLYVGETELKQENTLSADSSANGFDIEGMKINIIIAYSITKSVDKPYATIGDELIYTIAVKNDSQIALSGIDVTDTIPAGITILGTSVDKINWTPTSVAEGGVITLETGLRLNLGAAKTYYVKAYVNENVVDSATLTNKAIIGGDLIPKYATADVTVDTEAITVKKFVTGNFGDRSQVFSFTVTAVKGEHYSKQFTFNLSHDGGYTLPNLPRDAILTLTEVDSGDYKVSVVVDDVDRQPNTGGTYTINVDGMGVKTITVNNEKNVPIDTGIFLDTLLYVFIILVVVAIGLAFIVIRVRNIYSQEDRWRS